MSNILSEQMQRRGVRKAPQDRDKGRQRDDRAQQADPDVERAIDEQLDVVGHALVGVVGGVALKLHPVVVGLMQPVAEILRGHPAPPADLQPLIEIELVDRQHDEDGGKDAEIDDLGDEVVPVSFLQRVVEAAVPLIEQDVDRRRWPARWRSRPPAGRGRPICPRSGNRGRRCATPSRASSGYFSQIDRLRGWA